MCRLFTISRSSYYAWCNRPERTLKRDEIRSSVRYSFEKNKRTYGSPRLTLELQEQGIKVSRATVARVMRKESLIARPRARYVHTTDSAHGLAVAENILNRDFSASRLNEKWVSDISYIPTKQGWAYLTVILDLADRMVVSWSLSPDMSCQNTTLKALKIALQRRKINQPLLFHSDRGVQYCSADFRQVVEQNRWLSQSMSRKGNCWDNAVAESFFKSLKTEWVKKYKYSSIKEANKSIFDYIERWYNTKRKHSAIGYLSPLQKHLLFFNRSAA